MRIRERLAVQREAAQLYYAAVAGGATHDDAADAVCDAMKEKHGASINWATVIQIITLLLELLRPKTTAILIAALLCLPAVAEAAPFVCRNGSCSVAAASDSVRAASVQRPQPVRRAGGWMRMPWRARR